MLVQYRNGQPQSEVVLAVPELGSVPTLSRYENNKVELKTEKVVALLTFYGAPRKDIEEALDCLARAKQTPGWAPPADTSEAFRALFAMESRAKIIRVYHEASIPGMLQTRAYARSLMEEFNRTPREEGLRQRYQTGLDERLEFRMRRQALLEGDRGVIYEALIAEAALLTQRGGPAAQREQLRHLYNVVENKPRVHLRVLPGSSPRAGSALHNAITLIKPYDDDRGRAVYLENRNRGGELISEGPELEAYVQSLDELWLDIGSKEDTLKLIQHHIDQIKG
ncbi:MULTISPECIES: DUF5753 domain-containing protein [Streptomyces]|uniref:DUF5753 domain-containing protein n=2 Tax=Streptomyces TaxID=1883 RepID=UPI000DF9DC96|nr:MULTISPECIES: DUF5753 domain-containing protein [Streptomyces]MBT3100504.1 DUF5753 domain-containing protein [Streptomyces sp. CBG30]MBT3101715.1 DUF5753 domain-containing protein [Streptomyces sp. COG19]MBT3110001.1 DUF5753 domain-containing protein [Streptomyces sp. CYG20]RBL82508.1 hypothetical protein DDE05_37050 [Streptomyces cavourensis]